jgi:processive 1,2-diacylglycerol beta-glucosyltransferase
MKILITYVSAGTGHRRAAEAVYNYFKKNCQGADIEIIDALEKTNPVFRCVYSNGYLFLVNHALWLWQFLFWVTSLKWLVPVAKSGSCLINRLNSKRLIDFITGKKPDIVISTHFLPSEIVSYLNRTKAINSRLITVITDYGVHPFWIVKGTHKYSVASDYTKELLVSMGIDRINIIDSGIPVDPKFFEKYDKVVLARKFDFQPERFTVLISTGSSGIGEVEKVIEELHEEAQLLVVCANNRILYARLSRSNYRNVKVFGFIENMQELMAVSDMIITKPGGLTIAESLAMGLSPVFITAIPGQETENVRILAVNHIGVRARDSRLVKDIVLHFKYNPRELAIAKDAINKFKRPFAVKELCDEVCQGGIGAAC